MGYTDLKLSLHSTMEKQRLSNMVLTEREYANSVVNNDIDRTIDLFDHRNGRDIILFLLTCFMSSYDRFICKNIFTSCCMCII